MCATSSWLKILERVLDLYIIWWFWRPEIGEQKASRYLDRFRATILRYTSPVCLDRQNAPYIHIYSYTPFFVYARTHTHTHTHTHTADQSVKVCVWKSPCVCMRACVWASVQLLVLLHSTRIPIPLLFSLPSPPLPSPPASFDASSKSIWQRPVSSYYLILSLTISLCFLCLFSLSFSVSLCLSLPSLSLSLSFSVSLSPSL